MSRSRIPRVTWWLWGASFVLLAASLLALETDQPMGVVSLALGTGLGLSTATSLMLTGVRGAAGRAGPLD